MLFWTVSLCLKLKITVWMPVVMSLIGFFLWFSREWAHSHLLVLPLRRTTWWGSFLFPPSWMTAAVRPPSSALTVGIIPLSSMCLCPLFDCSLCSQSVLCAFDPFLWFLLQQAVRCSLAQTTLYANHVSCPFCFPVLSAHLKFYPTLSFHVLGRHILLFVVRCHIWTFPHIFHPFQARPCYTLISMLYLDIQAIPWYPGYTLISMLYLNMQPVLFLVWSTCCFCNSLEAKDAERVPKRLQSACGVRPCSLHLRLWPLLRVLQAEAGGPIPTEALQAGKKWDTSCPGGEPWPWV